MKTYIVTDMAREKSSFDADLTFVNARSSRTFQFHHLQFSVSSAILINPHIFQFAFWRILDQWKTFKEDKWKLYSPICVA